MTDETLPARTPSSDDMPTIADLKKAIAVQMTIAKEFARFLDKAFPGKNIGEIYTDLQMRHQMPASVYRIPGMVRITATG
jgi:hypothetical protein